MVYGIRSGAINNGLEEVLEVHSIEPQTSDKVQNDSGVLKKTDKGFGFVNDAFIPPYLLHEVSDGEQIKVVKIWDIAPKKTSPSWRVIIVEKS
jgi:exoribonuclease II